MSLTTWMALVSVFKLNIHNLSIIDHTLISIKFFVISKKSPLHCSDIVLL